MRSDRLRSTVAPPAPAAGLGVVADGVVAALFRRHRNVPKRWCSEPQAEGTATVTKDTMIGVDLAKRVFQLHGASMTGHVHFRKKLSRSQFERFMAHHPPAILVMEACAGAHFWTRELTRLGHEVKLIAPQYVRPFVKRQKNDAADAEAIVVAAQRPEMRFVEPKDEAAQARAVLFRSRARLVHQRTELINALRSHLYEFGHSFPQGLVQIKRISAFIEDPASAIPELVRAECRDLLDQIAETSARIDARMKRIKALATQTDTVRRLQTMPGVGPLIALAVDAFAPDMPHSGEAATSPPGWASCHASIPRAARSGWGASPKPDRSTSGACSSWAPCRGSIGSGENPSPRARGWHGCWSASRRCWSRSRWRTRWPAQCARCAGSR